MAPRKKRVDAVAEATPVEATPSPELQEFKIDGGLLAEVHARLDGFEKQLDGVAKVGKLDSLRNDYTTQTRVLKEELLKHFAEMTMWLQRLESGQLHTQEDLKAASKSLEALWNTPQLKAAVKSPAELPKPQESVWKIINVAYESGAHCTTYAMEIPGRKGVVPSVILRVVILDFTPTKTKRTESTVLVEGAVLVSKNDQWSVEMVGK